MPQPKGSTGNPYGRPKGAKNKTTLELKQWICKIIDDNREMLEADLQALEPMQRWQVIEKLMSYTIPKMSSTEAKIDLNRLSDEQLDEVVTNLKNAIDNE